MPNNYRPAIRGSFNEDLRRWLTIGRDLSPVAMGLLFAIALLAYQFSETPARSEARTTVMSLQVILAGWLLLLLKFRVTLNTGVWSIAGALWLILSSVAIFLSDHPYAGIYRQNEIIITVINAWLFCSYFSKSNRGLVAFTASYLVAINITWLLLLIKFLTPESLSQIDWMDGAGIYTNIRHMGDTAAAAAVISAYFISRRSILSRTYGLISLYASLVTLLFAAGRTSTCCALLGVVTLMWLHRNQHGYVTTIVFTVALSVYTAISMTPDTEMDGWEGIWRFLGSTISYQGNDFTSGRSDIWIAVLEQMKTQPWFGGGPDSYYYMSPFPFGQAPHNTLLEFALNWGWPAATIAVAWLIWMGIRGLCLIIDNGLKGKDHLSIYWVMAFGIFFIQSMLSTTLHEPSSLFLFIPMLAIAISATKKKSNEYSQTSPLLTVLIVIFLSFTYLVNSQYETTNNFNRKVLSNQEVTAQELLWVKEHPYQLEGIWQLIYKHRLDENVAYELSIELQSKIEKRSAEILAWQSAYWRKHGDSAKADELLDMAIAKRRILKGRFHLKSICSIAGAIEWYEQCADARDLSRQLAEKYRMARKLEP